MAVPMSRTEARLLFPGFVAAELPAESIDASSVASPVKHAAGYGRIVLISNQPRVGVGLLQQLGEQTTRATGSLAMPLRTLDA